jgi:hypothetical protein
MLQTFNFQNSAIFNQINGTFQQAVRFFATDYLPRVMVETSASQNIEQKPNLMKFISEITLSTSQIQEVPTSSRKGLVKGNIVEFSSNNS